ncbi:winged helix-turn-helix transcriptional regulator [Stenotrophomonas geniculata]|jgi:DNA-binding HxlR family transcriptional regulator|uniref:winged helix-turn-helix transcriptional regulator n=1 Tax=Stenotrophomonas TaxID=40323 RepID=UPI0006AA4F75|nr:helix-turn-helix domain-containing protein [Stenotrophomonas geniculata]ALA85879.1 HxlR family transcriptional regulator [Stenotrophomonas maltophilia]ALA89835.1 HxlR family transcriptional regulator [Stenotrophomonas maltophilia]MBH1404826.1 helix-turn-helix transcriptional regulator [Stenotrophomonas maltophilia]MBN5091146.1 helix-turn-helix transcriptional regulator [Stenotrophomonas maltophilia]MCI1054189.1 helix-turn-helix transcriptional regulator [Stenotrophomonas maltophilia]
MHADSPCPVARSADLLGDRWALLVIRDAFDGITRFGDFQRSLGAARNILSDRLRRLVEAGILQLRPASDGSVYQEYVLTAAGQELFPLLVALRQWGERHRFGMGEAHSQLVELATRRPLPYMQPRGRDGQPLQPAATRVRKLKDDGRDT